MYSLPILSQLSCIYSFDEDLTICQLALILNLPSNLGEKVLKKLCLMQTLIINQFENLMSLENKSFKTCPLRSQLLKNYFNPHEFDQTKIKN